MILMNPFETAKSPSAPHFQGVPVQWRAFAAWDLRQEESLPSGQSQLASNTQLGIVYVAIALSILTSFAAIGVLWGWSNQIDWFVRPHPGAPAVHPLTACGFLVLGIASSLCTYLLIWPRQPYTSTIQILSRFLSGICITFCLIQITGHFAGWESQLDETLFPHWTSNSEQSASRMSLLTAVLQTLIALGILCTTSLPTGRANRRFRVAELCFLAVLLLSLNTLEAHILGAEVFYGYFTSIYTAVFSASLALALLGCSMIVDSNWLLRSQRNQLATLLLSWILLLLLLMPFVLTIGHIAAKHLAALDGNSATFVNVALATLVNLVIGLLLLRKICELEESITSKQLKLQEMAFINKQIAENATHLIEASPVANVCVDACGTIVLVNQQLEKLFGYARDELIGNPVEILVPDNLKAEHPTLRNSYFQKPEVKSIGHQRDVFGRHKDGSLVPVELGISPIVTETGLVALGTLVDLTSRHVAEAKLHEVNQMLARSNSELEEFAYVASHDLQEPLRKITAYANLMQEECGKQLSANAQSYLNVIGGGAARMRVLINDLLSFSRIVSQGKELEPVSVGSALREALDRLELSIKENDAKINVGVLPIVMADRSQLVLLLQNLVSNALKYRGDAQPEIMIGSHDMEDEAEIYVRDNGIGIEPKYFERIFQIFQRLHNRRDYSGTGIGLALCKRIVERFGGAIRVESKPEEGSTFFFTARRAFQEH